MTIICTVQCSLATQQLSLNTLVITHCKQIMLIVGLFLEQLSVLTCEGKSI